MDALYHWIHSRSVQPDADVRKLGPPPRMPCSQFTGTFTAEERQNMEVPYSIDLRAPLWMTKRVRNHTAPDPDHLPNKWLLDPSQWLLPLSTSHNQHCRAVGAEECYLQVPKTGSSFAKSKLGLPIVGQRGESVTQCRHVLLTYRDPIERFISGVGTIYSHDCHMGGTIPECNMRPDCQSARKTYWCSIKRMETLRQFEDYALKIINLTYVALHKCEPFNGYMNHVLPQSAFAGVVGEGAQMYGVSVRALSLANNVQLSSQGAVRIAEMDAPGDIDTRGDTARKDPMTKSERDHARELNLRHCPLPRPHHSNEKEGVDVAILKTLKTSDLSPRLLRDLVRLYSDDYAWLRLPRPYFTSSGTLEYEHLRVSRPAPSSHRPPPSKSADRTARYSLNPAFTIDRAEAARTSPDVRPSNR